MSHNKNYHQQQGHEFISIIKLVKWTFLPYFAFQILQFLFTLSRNPENLLETTKTFIELSGWGYLIMVGPFVLVGVGINYFMSITTLTNLPQDTTLYEAITQTTMMVGNVKVIFPKIEEENELLAEDEMGKK